MENNNIENTTTAVSWMEKLLELSKKYTVWDYIKTITTIIILGIIVICFSNPVGVVNYFEEASAKQHIELLQKRQENSVEVQRICDRLLYKTGADRVEVLELHNSISNVSGLPFLKASCTTESINDNIYPIAMQYQSTNLSLIPFANYLYNQGYWQGNTVQMKSLDKSLCYKMLSNNATYFFAGIIPSSNKPIGFIFISYCNDKVPEHPEILKIEAQKAAMQIGVLLEMKKKI